MIPSAQVKTIEVNTGAVRIVQSNADGRFLFSQVNPGTYRIEVHSNEFGPAQSQPTSVSVGQTVTVNFTLFPAATEQTVEVREQFGLMSLENPNTSTTLETETIKNLPNPGPGDHRARQAACKARAEPHRAASRGRWMGC